jgi:Family of unknown function (DUF6082)
MMLSVIATLISSVALVGVAIGLIIQTRQLRASQLQAARSLHVEFIKLAMENPSIGTAMEPDFSFEEASKAAYMNLYFIFLQTSYSLTAVSKGTVSLQAGRFFTSEYPRMWWERARNAYTVEATTKRDREFVALVDAKFQEAMRRLQSPDGQATNPSTKLA